MSGQMNLFNEQQNMVDEYAERMNIYGDMQPLRFDLRAYYSYLNENRLSGDSVPNHIMDTFKF